MEQEYINASLGRRIKELRQLNGLTQQELADRTELTKGFISQLERGQVSPSVATLLDLIECLGISASDFFKQAEKPKVVFSEEGFFEKIDDFGNSIQWIVPTAQGNSMEPLLVELQPGSTLETDKPHSGEEFGYVITGSIQLYLGDKKYTVKKGESFYYEASEKHHIENQGTRKARFIWVSTPPSF